MNSKFRKRMALLISMCLLFSSLLVDTAAGTGDALDGAFPTPAAEETLEPSVTAEPTRDATVPSSDEPTVTPAVEESPEPSVTASPTPHPTEPSSDEPAVTPAAEESPEPSVTASPTPNTTEPSTDETAPTPAIDESPEPSATASPTPDTTEMPPSDPGVPADTEAPLYEDETQNPPGGDEGAPPSVTIELAGGAKVSRFTGMIARSGDAAASSDYQLTRNQVIELEARSAYAISGAHWSLSDTSIAAITGTSFSFVVSNFGSYYAYSAKIKGLKTGIVTLSFLNGSNTVLQTATISVTTPVTGIELDNETLYVGIGQSAQLEATISPADADDLMVTWSSLGNH